MDKPGGARQIQKRGDDVNERWRGALYMLAGISAGLLAAALVGGMARILMTAMGWL